MNTPGFTLGVCPSRFPFVLSALGFCFYASLTILHAVSDAPRAAHLYSLARRSAHRDEGAMPCVRTISPSTLLYSRICKLVLLHGSVPWAGNFPALRAFIHVRHGRNYCVPLATETWSGVVALPRSTSGHLLAFRSLDRIQVIGCETT